MGTCDTACSDAFLGLWCVAQQLCGRVLGVRAAGPFAVLVMRLSCRRTSRHQSADMTSLRYHSCGSVMTPDVHLLQDAWVRVASTVFNGASNVSQAGGIACLKVNEANSDNWRPDVQGRLLYGHQLRLVMATIRCPAAGGAEPGGGPGVVLQGERKHPAGGAGCATQRSFVTVKPSQSLSMN